MGSGEAIHVLLTSLPAEYQVVGAAWSLYGVGGALLGLAVGLCLVPFRSIKPESAWCAAFVLVGAPLASLLVLRGLDARLYEGVGVPVTVAAGVGGSALLLGAISWWMGRNILVKTPLRMLATLRGTTAFWGAGLMLAWVFGLSPAPVLSGRAPAMEQPGPGAPDLILVVVDSLRADAIGAYGAPQDATPNLDALAKDGIVFEQAVAASTTTPSAIASLYTSLAVSSHGCERQGEFLDPESLTLAEVMAARGYRTIGLPNDPAISGTRGFAQGFQSYPYLPNHPLGASESTAELFAFRLLLEWLPAVAPEMAGAPVHTASGTLVERALAQLGEEGAPPAFVLLQLVEPPGAPGMSAPGQDAVPPVPSEGPAVGDDRANVRAVDAALGRLLEGLRSTGRYGTAAIVVTAGHGAPLANAADGRGAMRDATVRVPLLVKLPGLEQAGTRVPWQVRSIDIAPTLVDLGGSRPPPQWQGMELFTDSFDQDLALLQPPEVADGEVPPPDWRAPDWTNHPASRDALVESSGPGLTHRALRRGGVKVVATLETRGSGEETPADLEFYDLLADPLETRDQSAVQSTLQAGMRAAMESMVADRRRKAVGRGAAELLPGGERCGRCALGYLSPEECADCLPPPKPR